MNETTIKSKSLERLGMDELKAARAELNAAHQRFFDDQTAVARRAVEKAQAKVWEIEDAYRRGYMILLGRALEARHG